MTTTMRYPPRYPSMVPAMSRESLREPLQPRDGVGMTRVWRVALTVVGTAVIMIVLACWAVTPRHGPAPAALAVVGFFEDTAAPWMESLLSHKAGDHGPVRAAAVPNSFDAFIPEPPPSCPIGKIEDAYHLNVEHGTCQQVCISRGLRGVFIAHGGVIGGYCVELGFEEYIGAGKRSGIKFYIYAPVGSDEAAAAQDAREAEIARVQRDGERDAANEKAQVQAEKDAAQAQKDAAYNADKLDREKAALAEREAAAYEVQAKKDVAQAQKDAAYNADKLDRELAAYK
ncbi:hypothetical protein T492DRAFT_228357 [Pavlovales sp. CCMP2436]|nr:hypothetical protein T492DRAFT_228357 [Pavlovales sp. CCMP2436]